MAEVKIRPIKGEPGMFLDTESGEVFDLEEWAVAERVRDLVRGKRRRLSISEVEYLLSVAEARGATEKQLGYLCLRLQGETYASIARQFNRSREAVRWCVRYALSSIESEAEIMGWSSTEFRPWTRGRANDRHRKEISRMRGRIMARTGKVEVKEYFFNSLASEASQWLK